jgi:hypothetical protein
MHTTFRGTSPSPTARIPTFTQFRWDMILCFASRPSPTSGAPFDQFKAMCPGPSIVGGADSGRTLDRDVVYDEVAGVGVCLEARNAPFTMCRPQ